MKLWLLKPVQDERDLAENHRAFTYDRYQAFVIRARYEDEARQIAVGKAEGEPAGETYACVWADPTMTSCVPLAEEGEPGVILSDYLRG